MNSVVKVVKGAGVVLLMALLLVAGLFYTVGMVTPVRDTVVVRDDGIADEVESVRDAVVHVLRLGQWQGSGCLISADGILFTAKHVTDGTHADYEVRMDDGRRFPVKYVIEDKENDVSFMQLDLLNARRPGPQSSKHDMPGDKYFIQYEQEPDLPYAQLAEHDNLRVGDKVFIMGSPLGVNNFNSVSLGIVSHQERDLYNRGGWERYHKYNWHVMIQSTSPAFPGNSGGPVFDLDGDVIGVLVAGEAETLNFSVPVARFRDTIDAVRDHFRLCRFNVVAEDDVDEGELYYRSRVGYLKNRF